MMLSFTRIFTTSPVQAPYSFAHSQPHSLVVIRNSSSSEEGDDPAASNNNSLSATSPITTTPKPVDIRFRRISRRRKKQEEEDTVEKKAMKQASVPKDWDNMTLAEKAVEVYMGEKGMLFWLNKFAYASIFIVIGGWILFRFVGPALNLYQLDSPPLSPTSMFK